MWGSGRRYRWALALCAALPWLPAPARGGEPPVIPPLVPVPAPLPERSRFHDWTLSCAKGCRATTRLRSTAPGAPEVLRFTVAPAGPEVFALSLRTPAPLYLPAPLTLMPDRGDPLEAPWFTCDPAGCEARVTAGTDLADALRKGRFATVELTLVDGSRARLRLSLSGFTAALAAATRISPPAPAEQPEPEAEATP